MAKAKRLPSGSYRALAFSHKDASGHRFYESFTAATPEEAEYLAAEFRMTKKKNKTPANLSLGKAMEQYITDKSNVLSPSTIRGYDIMRRNAFEGIKNAPLKSLSNGDALQKAMNQNAKEYSAKSLRNQFGFLSAVFSYYGLVIPKCTLKAKEERSIPVPAKAEAEKIMKLLTGTPIECQALLALSCSLRQSEIAALTKKSIEDDIVHVRGALIYDKDNKLVYKPTNKSAAGTRDVIMPEYLTEKIQEVCKNSTGQYLFDISPIQVEKRFKHLLKKNGMPEYSIHSLRHCFAAILHANNVPDKYIMEMGGWSSESVMKKIYQYTFEEEAKKAKESVNSYFDKVYNATQNATQKRKYTIKRRSISNP